MVSSFSGAPHSSHRPGITRSSALGFASVTLSSAPFQVGQRQAAARLNYRKSGAGTIGHTAAAVSLAHVAASILAGDG